MSSDAVVAATTSNMSQFPNFGPSIIGMTPLCIGIFKNKKDDPNLPGPVVTPEKSVITLDHFPFNGLDSSFALLPSSETWDSEFFKLLFYKNGYYRINSSQSNMSVFHFNNHTYTTSEKSGNPVNLCDLVLFDYCRVTRQNPNLINSFTRMQLQREINKYECILNLGGSADTLTWDEIVRSLLVDKCIAPGPMPFDPAQFPDPVDPMTPSQVVLYYEYHIHSKVLDHTVILNQPFHVSIRNFVRGPQAAKTPLDMVTNSHEPSPDEADGNIL